MLIRVRTWSGTHPIGAASLAAFVLLVLWDALRHTLFMLAKEEILPELPSTLMWPLEIHVTRFGLALSMAGTCYWLGLLRRRAGLSLRPAWAAVIAALALSVVERVVYGDVFSYLEFGVHLWSFPRNIVLNVLTSTSSLQTHSAILVGQVAGWLLALVRRNIVPVR